MTDAIEKAGSRLLMNFKASMKDSWDRLEDDEKAVAEKVAKQAAALSIAKITEGRDITKDAKHVAASLQSIRSVAVEVINTAFQEALFKTFSILKAFIP